MFKKIKSFFQNNYKRRGERVSLNVLHNVLLFVQAKNTEQFVNYPVLNLSVSGLAFNVEGPSKSFKIGDKIKVELEVYGKNKEVFDVEIVRFQGTMVGAQIKSNEVQYRAMIQKYFDNEITALSPMKLPDSAILEEKEGYPLYFHGKSCEFYIVVLHDKLVSFELTYFGNIIRMDKNQKVLTGYNSNTADNQVEFIEQDGISMDIIQNVLRLISITPGISPVIKEQLAKKLQSFL
jgi:hypothetical protein